MKRRFFSLAVQYAFSGILALSAESYADVVNKEISQARRIADLEAPIEGRDPYTLPEIDDSTWQTIALPLSPDALNLWPDGANGTIWYRRTFSPATDLSQPCRFDKMKISLGKTTRGFHVYLNGTKASVRIRPDDSLSYSPWPPTLQPGTNTIAVGVAVRDGQGGIPPCDPADMNIYMCFGIRVMGKSCQYIVEDEWTIPLAGEWKCLFVPSTFAPP